MGTDGLKVLVVDDEARMRKLVRDFLTVKGFYVLEGEGFAKLDDLVFPIKAGDSFVALAGVKHTLRTKEGCTPVKVFWFHSGI